MGCAYSWLFLTVKTLNMTVLRHSTAWTYNARQWSCLPTSLFSPRKRDAGDDDIEAVWTQISSTLKVIAQAPPQRAHPLFSFSDSFSPTPITLLYVRELCLVCQLLIASRDTAAHAHREKQYECEQRTHHKRIQIMRLWESHCAVTSSVALTWGDEIIRGGQDAGFIVSRFSDKGTSAWKKMWMDRLIKERQRKEWSVGTHV